MAGISKINKNSKALQQKLAEPISVIEPYKLGVNLERFEEFFDPALSGDRRNTLTESRQYAARRLGAKTVGDWLTVLDLALFPETVIHSWLSSARELDVPGGKRYFIDGPLTYAAFVKGYPHLSKGAWRSSEEVSPEMRREYNAIIQGLAIANTVVAPKVKVKPKAKAGKASAPKSRPDKPKPMAKAKTTKRRVTH